jgi:hypothetical protein
MRSFRQVTRAIAAGLPVLVFVALGVAPARAQTLIHRYSFNGDVKDSVGTAKGKLIGTGVTLDSSTLETNGAAVFSGAGTSGASPSYISLPMTAVDGLQNATVEIFTTDFNPPANAGDEPGGQYQTLFALSSKYGTQTDADGNYVLLTPNFGAQGIGLSESTGGAAPATFASHDPLPDWMTNHVIDLVFSGFDGIGSTGYETIYLDGQLIAQGSNAYSFADVAAGTGGVSVCGIGGGSPYDDPNFSGSIDEVRIYDDALTQAQIAANVASGPAKPLPLIEDAGFETPSVGSSFQFNPTGSAWTFTGQSGIVGDGSKWGKVNAPDGTQAAIVQGDGATLGSILQQVYFPLAGSYEITYESAQRGGYVGEPLQLSIDGVNVGTPQSPKSTAYGLKTTAAFTVTAGVHSIEFSATNNTGDHVTLIDSLSVIAS